MYGNRLDKPSSLYSNCLDEPLPKVNSGWGETTSRDRSLRGGLGISHSGYAYMGWLLPCSDSEGAFRRAISGRGTDFLVQSRRNWYMSRPICVLRSRSVLSPCYPAKDLISQKEFINWFQKVNSPTKSSTSCSLSPVKVSS